METVEIEIPWAQIFKHAPMTILVNTRQNYYHVRDNTLMIVWAADLPKGRYPELMRGIVGALRVADPRAVKSMLAAQALMEAFRNQEIGRSARCLQPARQMTMYSGRGQYSEPEVAERSLNCASSVKKR